MTDPTLDAAFARFDAGEMTAREVADVLADALARRLKAALDAIGINDERIPWTPDTVSVLTEEAWQVVKPYVDRVPFEPAPTLVVHGLLTL
jgi:hypothetical protein